MTNKEAIMILESIQPSCGEKYSYSESEKYEALDIAIEALSSSEIPNSSDTICRQDAIKTAHLPTIEDAGYEVIRLDDILALPPAQPEIIRCKDCKHYYYADNRIPQEQRYSCDLDGDRWKPEDFCSYAERRGEQDE